MNENQNSLYDEKLRFIEHVRLLRPAVFLKLDEEYWLAKKSESDTSGIVKLKQDLRDAPQLAEKANSLDQLRVLWPEVLGKYPFDDD